MTTRPNVVEYQFADSDIIQSTAASVMVTHGFAKRNGHIIVDGFMRADI